MDAARKVFTADSLGLRRGLNPDDPSATIAYFINGNTTFELDITQSFDFPTVYHHRNKLSKLGIERITDDLFARRRELIVEMSDLYIAAAYNGALVQLLEHRSASLENVLKLSKKAVEIGDQTILDLMQSRSMTAESRSLLLSARSEYDQAVRQLTALAGGYEMAVQPNAYPAFAFSGDCGDFISAAMAGDYAMRAAVTDSLIAARTLRLGRSEWLPRLVAGYRLNLDAGSPSHAVIAGVSIPLWQNRGNVKHAKAQIAAARAVKADTESRLRVSLENLYSRYEAADRALEGYNSADMQYPQMLGKVVDGGGITSIEYLLALVDWYEIEQDRIALEYQRAMAGARMSIFLAD